MSHRVRRRTYPSDLSDAQWRAIAPLVTPTAENRPGRRRETDLREVLNAVNYRWMSGCVWRMIPHDLPSWNTVYMYAHRWEEAGLLSKIRTLLLTSPTRLTIVKHEIYRQLREETCVPAQQSDPKVR